MKERTRAAVAEALTRRRGELESAVRRRYGSLDAGEVYQRAALRALERSGELKDTGRVDAWVRRIVVTSALDLLRERQRQKISPSTDDEALERFPAAVPEVDESCACTIALLASLPAAYADVLRRVDVDGASLDDVARDLRIEKNNATVRLHRARAALRGRLREHCGVDTMRECLTCVCNDRGCCGTS